MGPAHTLENGGARTAHSSDPPRVSFQQPEKYTTTHPDYPISQNGPTRDDAGVISPEVSALLEREGADIGLEVDDNDDDDDEDEDGDYGEGEAMDHDAARSVYAMSMCPGAGSTFQAEHGYENGQDAATIDSARTLYADDFDFVMENGRQYCGDYFLPIDQTEQTRQYVIHQVFLKVFDLELTTVPLDKPTYILDVGTGIGEWAIGMAEKYPQCEVFGTDIAPIQPTQQVPFNIEFHIENAEDEWIRPNNAVDLVHFRNMEGAFSDWPFIYGQAFACLKPGAWIEIMEWEDFFSTNNFLSFFADKSAPHVLFRAILDAAEVAGRPRDSRALRREQLAAANFIDIQETVHDLGIGARESSSYGKFWLFSIITGVEAASMRLLTRYLGWDPNDVHELCENVADEIKAISEDPDRAEAFVVKLRVTIGRKPTNQAGVGRSRAEDSGGNGRNSEDESTIGARTIRSEATA
ncbi:S-adenosyl-L-methionine-dependent methyltransferase [Dichotomopilus funicola]|uniref:S-adenosyl-L-methionine-dependent methyltransferase n=1 Tax=Dichotomopilus funicola TaxID=1934379 RepID=A0AAN6V2T3_9PEZI|nr:S-adenosyl-L-methionine-dependent methyltransferase [Dichotomopilus funicola]